MRSILSSSSKLPTKQLLNQRLQKNGSRMSPRLAPYLTNNESPLQTILQEIKKAIEDPIEKSSRNKAEIERVEKYLQELRHTQTNIETALTPYYIVLSPIRRVPPDILREFFFHCLPTQHNPIVSSSEAPLLLTQICRTWRETALSSPRIWARLHIPFSDVILEPDIQPEDPLVLRHAQVMDQRCKVVMEWLSRSGDLPLSISLHYIPTSHLTALAMEYSETAVQRLLKIILPLVKRWKDLQLSIPLNIYEKIQAELAIDRSGSPMLQSLKIMLKYDQSTSQEPVLNFQIPNLQRLSVANEWRAKWNIKNIPAITERLTVLNCHTSFSNIDVLKLLSKLPNLVHFKGRLVDADDSEEHAELLYPVMVSLPSLMSFCVVDGGSVDIMTKIYGFIDAPLVKWVSYQRHGYYRDLSTDNELSGIPLPALPLLRQAVSVKKLSLEQYCLRIDDIICSFRLLPTLSHLVVGDLHSSVKVFGRGVQVKQNFDLNLLILDENSSSEEILLPNLLAFEAHSVTDLSDETLLRFITSRTNPNLKTGIAVLKFVHVTFARAKQRDIREEVNKCAKAAGIELELNLVYPETKDKYLDPLSSSCGLNMDGHSTERHDIEESDFIFC